MFKGKITYRVSIFNFIAWLMALACGINSMHYMITTASLAEMGSWNYWSFWVITILFTLYGGLPIFCMIIILPIWLYFSNRNSIYNRYKLL